VLQETQQSLARGMLFVVMLCLADAYLYAQVNLLRKKNVVSDEEEVEGHVCPSRAKFLEMCRCWRRG